jgi:hypothetical protein
MTEIRVNISELNREGSDVVKELVEFLKKKTQVEVETLADEIAVKGDGKTVSKSYLRVLLRKFLHKQELKEYFRVIGAKEDTLIVKERKIAEEE